MCRNCRRLASAAGWSGPDAPSAAAAAFLAEPGGVVVDEGDRDASPARKAGEAPAGAEPDVAAGADAAGASIPRE